MIKNYARHKQSGTFRTTCSIIRMYYAITVPLSKRRLYPFSTGSSGTEKIEPRPPRTGPRTVDICDLIRTIGRLESLETPFWVFRDRRTLPGRKGKETVNEPERTVL